MNGSGVVERTMVLRVSLKQRRKATGDSRTRGCSLYGVVSFAGARSSSSARGSSASVYTRRTKTTLWQ
jgi:hypothetical protein